MVWEAPAGPWAPSPRHALQASDWKEAAAEDQALQNMLATGPLENPFSLQPAASPRAWPCRGCCDSKPQCHGNDCATPGAGCLQSRAVSAQHQLAPSSQLGASFSVPSHSLSLCCAWRGLILDPEISLLQGDLQARSPF